MILPCFTVPLLGKNAFKSYCMGFNYSKKDTGKYYRVISPFLFRIGLTLLFFRRYSLKSTLKPKVSFISIEVSSFSVDSLFKIVDLTMQEKWLGIFPLAVSHSTSVPFYLNNKTNNNCTKNTREKG
jgi:hypothetical protein